MHKTSIGFDVVGFGGNLIYKRGPVFPTYTIKKIVYEKQDEDTPADYVSTSFNDIVDAGVIAERSGSSIELIVRAAEGMPAAMVRKRIDDLIGDGVTYKQQVFEKLPYQNNTAFMGGIGASAGYHYHLSLVICNVRAGLDYMWGKFKKFDLYPSSLTQMGWGVKVGGGIDYKLTDKATFGFEGGIRLNAFRNPQISQSRTITSWFVLPYVQMICGFSPHPDYGISAFMGYFLPTKFSISANGGRIPSGTMCKVDGMFGGLRFVRYF